MKTGFALEEASPNNYHDMAHKKRCWVLPEGVKQLKAAEFFHNDEVDIVERRAARQKLKCCKYRRLSIVEKIDHKIQTFSPGSRELRELPCNTRATTEDYGT